VELQLKLDWAGVDLNKVAPVTAGVPLARGELQDATATRLSIEGEATPLQSQALATWPDGSVKWLLLDFQAPVGAPSAVLEYGPGVRGLETTTPIRATQVDNSVWVDAGTIAFEVKAPGSGLLDRLLYRGEDVLASGDRRLSFMDAIHVASPAQCGPMDRWIADAQDDPSRVVVERVRLETAGPLRVTVVIEGRYTYKLVGSTITGTDVKGDCPFRVRLTAWADQPMLQVEHFFYYEGDSDHDFVSSLGLALPLAVKIERARLIGRGLDGSEVTLQQPAGGLYQQTCDACSVWHGEDGTRRTDLWGGRFEGVLDVSGRNVGIAVGIRDFWQQYAKGLDFDRDSAELRMMLWPDEAPPLDFRPHSRDWSVGETGTPPDPDGDKPLPNELPNQRLASKGVGKTHYALLCLHDGNAPADELQGCYDLFNHRPIAWASPQHYADTLALGHYHAPRPGMFEELEESIEAPLELWRHGQEHFRWYGFWLYGNVVQSLHHDLQNGRWNQEFGRWGWANGDSVGRLSQALALAALRRCRREHLEFAEKFMLAVHDTACTHSEAYPSHYGERWVWVKGAAHRHGAWPWACPYMGIRGAYPVGAKIYHFLTGLGHFRDIVDEVTQLSVINPHGGAGDGPLGINAQVALMQWEMTGLDRWRNKLRVEVETSELLKSAEGGWMVMLSAAFGIFNALEEYMELTGDESQAELVPSFANRAMPEIMRDHWSWGGYFRVYGFALRLTNDPKYRQALDEMLPIYVDKIRQSTAQRLARGDWPGPAGAPGSYVDGNIIRDIPYAMYAMAQDDAREGK
jgi:hypothetical protein